MIKLQKGDEPEILLNNAKAWTDTLLNKMANNIKPTDTDKTRYRHPEIKKELVKETNGKCAYCESKLLHIHHGDVEHIMPKSLDPSKIVQWDNPTLACEICNQRKSNLDPSAEYIIDPYEIDPAEHLAFAGALVLSRGTQFGTSSKSILDLNRGELTERRKEHLDGLCKTMEVIFREDLPLSARQAMFQSFLTAEIASDTAYSAMGSAFAQQMIAHLPDEVTNAPQPSTGDT